jgi:hypothetical protein
MVLHPRFMPLAAAGALAGVLAMTQATAASAATTDTVQIRAAEYNLATGQLTIVAADTDTAAVLTATVTATGLKIGALTNYYSAADPTDVQAGVFKVVVNGQAIEPTEITVTSNLGGQASSPVSRYVKEPY